MEFDALSTKVIGCAIEVHRQLGPGLLESTYQRCLAHELARSGLHFALEKHLPVVYKDIKLDCGYRIDIFFENQLIVELKSVNSLLGIHKAQILTYMKLSNTPVGLLMNFNEVILKNGIRRFVL